MKHQLDMDQIYVILKVTLRKRNLEWEKLKEKSWNAMRCTLNEALKKYLFWVCVMRVRGQAKAEIIHFVVVTRNWVSTKGIKICHGNSEQKEKKQAIERARGQGRSQDTGWIQIWGGNITRLATGHSHKPTQASLPCAFHRGNNHWMAGKVSCAQCHHLKQYPRPWKASHPRKNWVSQQDSFLKQPQRHRRKTTS